MTDLILPEQARTSPLDGPGDADPPDATATPSADPKSSEPATPAGPMAAGAPRAPSAAAPSPSDAPPARDDRTVDLTKHDTITHDLPQRDDVTVRVDRDLPPSWSPGPVTPAQPSTPPLPGTPAGPGWSPPPSPWAAPSPGGQPPPSWPAPPNPPWPPTRAMTPPTPLPPSTPPLPAPGGRGSGALIVFGILAALIIGGGAFALISLAAGSSPFGPRADAPVTSDAPFPSDPILPPTTDASPETNAPSDGPSGQVTVRWDLSGVDYEATLTTFGSTGNAVVTYTDPDDGQVRTVRQNVTLASSDGRRGYVGSDPVDADTGGPATFYSPDVFLLASNEEGKVYIDQVCDTSGVCAPATMG